MKTLQNIIWEIVFITVFASCESPQQLLSKPESRQQIMNVIANDSKMSKEMIETILSSDSGKMMMRDHMKMMMKNRAMMTKMMNDHPEMNRSMMSSMMESAKADTSLKAGMCKMMMEDPQMMGMMQKMKEKKGMKMKEMK